MRPLTDFLILLCSCLAGVAVPVAQVDDILLDIDDLNLGMEQFVQVTEEFQ